MGHKVSNVSKKNNIHIHIGEKSKKKRHRHHRKKLHPHGHSNVIMNHVTPMVAPLPLFNRPQYLDTTLADERERERIRLQRSTWESPTPVSSNTYANAPPVNDSIFRNPKPEPSVKKTPALPKQEPPSEPRNQIPSLPKKEPPPPSPKEVKHKKEMPHEHEYKHKESIVFRSPAPPPTNPEYKSEESDFIPDPVPSRVAPFTSQNQPTAPVAPFTSQNAPSSRVGAFTSQVPTNTELPPLMSQYRQGIAQNPSMRRLYSDSHHVHHTRSSYAREEHSDNITNARLRERLRKGEDN